MITTAYLHDGIAFQPCYKDASSPVTALVDTNSGWFVETGKVLCKKDKEPIYKELKKHEEYLKLTRYQKLKAKRYIRQKKDILIYQYVVDEAIEFARQEEDTV